MGEMKERESEKTGNKWGRECKLRFDPVVATSGSDNGAMTGGLGANKGRISRNLERLSRNFEL